MLSIIVINFIVASIYKGSFDVLVITVWADILVALIESILYLSKSKEKFAKTYVAGKRPWF
jgi:hypothetical protein